MAHRQRESLARLNIAPAKPYPIYNDMNGGLYSPALPTPGFMPMGMQSALQTPMQAFFNPQLMQGPPGAPQRPGPGHRAGQSMSYLNPLTPLAGHFPRPSMAGGAPGQFPHRNRRQLSIGGPPKAVLGGPQRKLSPLPGTAEIVATPTASTSATPVPPPVKVKKVVVNLPKEKGEDGEEPPEWARQPLRVEPATYDAPPPEIASVESYPGEEWCTHLPPTLDVFLPGKRAWEAIKQKEIEEKLEKLGVERAPPLIHAPHARAASVSSPADPALLLFKLNKLQQQQQASPGPSSPNGLLPVSPQGQAPFIGLTPSPRFANARMGGHGYSMSLAPTSQPFFNSTSSPSPAISPALGGLGRQRSPLSIITVNEATGHNNNPSIASAVGGLSGDGSIHAPQGRVPVFITDANGGLSVPSSGPVSRPESGASKPDFIRGFGLDIPEESEEELEEEERNNGYERDQDRDQDESEDEDYDEDKENQHHRGLSTSSNLTAHNQSALANVFGGHARHESRLSAALSMRSFAGLVADGLKERADVLTREEAEEMDREIDGLRRDRLSSISVSHQLDGVEEWTGSEDVPSGDESIGEWSNPSDEERARQQRVAKRARRAQREAEQQQQLGEPRRLPEFPRPPENSAVFLRQAEDDMISNPSEEEGMRMSHLLPMSQNGMLSRSPGSRPLPELPHSRSGSGQHTLYDPAHAHSRRPSYGSHSQHLSGQLSSHGRSASLNPFAAPFVFGAPRVQTHSNANSNATGQEHSRGQSFAKPLNVAAQEFRPSGGFTFRAEQPMPASISFPHPHHHSMQSVDSNISSRPLPNPPHQTGYESPFKVQGREKRQKVAEDDAVDEEGDSMISFKFPISVPPSVRKPAPTASLNPAAKPFTFAGFSSASAASMPRIQPRLPGEQPEETAFDQTAFADLDEEEDRNFTFSTPPPGKSKPAPLDFKHPVSNNTIPAGVFKALASGNSVSFQQDERTRRTVRSRLSSHDIFERSPRQSLDDTSMPQISLARKASRQRLVTDPAGRPLADDEDVFGAVAGHIRRRSSLPDDTRRPVMQRVLSEGSVDMSEDEGIQRGAGLDIRHVEYTLEKLLDMKLGKMKNALQTVAERSAILQPETETMLADVLSLFRTQVRERASRGGPDDSRMDYELIKNVVERSHHNAMDVMRQEISELMPRLSMAHANVQPPDDFVDSLEHFTGRTIKAVRESISDLAARVSASNRNIDIDHDAIVTDLVSALVPVIHSNRPEPVDYDYITEQLSHAVKPHISQLIDLSSDKRETAALIVEKLLPILPAQQALDTDAITLKLVTEVRRAIAPIDAFEIKEQVADLVVERLDSRLAVRDKAFNVETITKGVAETLLEPIARFSGSISGVVDGQRSIATEQAGLAGAISAQVEAKVVAALQAQPQGSSISDTRAAVEEAVRRVTQEQLKELHSKLDSLPDSFLAATNALHSAHADFLLSKESQKNEVDDLRKANTDLQVQVVKARGAHGQVRVEKDVLNEKLAIVESDRDRLRTQIRDLQSNSSGGAAELKAVEARNVELQAALEKALGRLQTADVVTQSNQERITELEKANRELNAEKQTLRSKADGLDLQMTFAKKDQASLEVALAKIQKQHDNLAAQQSHWEDLRSVSEKMDLLTSVVAHSDKEELSRVREQNSSLEDEKTALKKRVRELESANEKAAAIAKQTLTQTQQRAIEWERRAKDAEGDLESTRTKLDQAEQTQSQLDADLSAFKMQVDSQDTNSRVARDRESKLREQIVALETKITLMQSQLSNALDQARAARSVTNTPATPSPAPAPARYNNGNGNGNANGYGTRASYSRPDSRASTAYGDRDSDRTPPPRNGTLWDSMHNPANANRAKAQTQSHAPVFKAPPTAHPQSRYSQTSHSVRSTARTPLQNNRQLATMSPPSPTPSNVSLAPTLGDDGWWS